jgi:hypothetical protein
MGSPLSKRPKINEKGEVVPPSPFEGNYLNSEEQNSTTATTTTDSVTTPASTLFSNPKSNDARTPEKVRDSDSASVQSRVLPRTSSTSTTTADSEAGEEELGDEEEDDEEVEERSVDCLAPLPSLKVGSAGRTIVSEETDRKTTKLASFSDIASGIENIPHLLVSGIGPAESCDALTQEQVVCIINCAPDVVTTPVVLDDDSGMQQSWSSNVHRWWLSDDKSERIEPFFFRALDIIEGVRVAGKGKCLIHCYQGVSRSVTLVIAYLMWLENMTYQDALDCVRRTRGIARPNIGFQCQVTLWRSMYMDVSKGSLDAPRLYRATKRRNELLLSLCLDSARAYEPAVPSMEMLTCNGVHVLHVPHPQSDESIATVFLIWTGDLVEQESLSSVLNAAVADIRLMLKYGKRFQEKKGDGASAEKSNNVGGHSIKCVRGQDATTCSVDAASKQEMMLFWKTLGAISPEAGEEMIRNCGHASAAARSTLDFAETTKESIVRRGEGGGGARGVEEVAEETSAAVDSGVVQGSEWEEVGGGGGEEEGGHNFPALYLRKCCSQYEHLSTYDDDDLDPEHVVVLRVSNELVYVCVGCECVDDDISTKTDEEVGAHMVRECQQGLFGPMSELSVVVVREGISSEWEDFMDAFAEGL